MAYSCRELSIVQKSALLQRKRALFCVGDEMNTRLRSERERLGLTQPAFAEIAGAAKRTVVDWEKGISSPTGVQLAKLGVSGVDVSFVLTGVRSVAKAGATPDDIARMNRLVDDFFALPRDDQDKVLAWTTGLVHSAVKRGDSVGVRRAKPPARLHQASVHEEPATSAARPSKPSEAA